MSFFCLPLLHEVAALLRNSHLELSKLKTCQRHNGGSIWGPVALPVPRRVDFVYPPGGACPEGQTGRISASRSAVQRSNFETLRNSSRLKEKKRKKKKYSRVHRMDFPQTLFSFCLFEKKRKSLGSSQSGKEYLQNGCVKKLNSPEWFVCSITHYESNRG